MDASKWKPHPIVARIRGRDTSTLTVVVSGYLAEPYIPKDSDDPKDPKDWTWRLYRTLDLKEYIEFYVGDVVDYEDVWEDSQTEVPEMLAKAVIWLNSEAKVSAGPFLIGELANAYMPEANVSGSFASQQEVIARNVQISYPGGPGCGSYGAAPPCGQRPQG